MRTFSRLRLAPLLLAFAAAPAAAQPARAQAATTLDVCQDDATGNWRYAGVVSVRNGAATEASTIRIGYWIQNRVSGIVYRDIVEAPPLPALSLPTRLAPARVAAYSIDAPPLVLGSLRGTARITIEDPLDPAAPAVFLAPTYDMNAAVCGCGQPKGCVRTQGYWGNKPGVVWPAPYKRGDYFYASTLTAQQILDTPPSGGNAYLILAHQTLAALMNKAAGASVPAGVDTVLNQATAWFSAGVNLDTCRASACELQKSWAGILDTYNQGQYPWAPRHCPN
jgi:hypothetical protein